MYMSTYTYIHKHIHIKFSLPPLTPNLTVSFLRGNHSCQYLSR